MEGARLPEAKCWLLAIASLSYCEKNVSTPLTNYLSKGI